MSRISQPRAPRSSRCGIVIPVTILWCTTGLLAIDMLSTVLQGPIA